MLKNLNSSLKFQIEITLFEKHIFNPQVTQQSALGAKYTQKLFYDTCYSMH